jgi:hypothetical protein
MQNTGQVVLASNAAAGTGSAYQWLGGKGSFIAEATWGGGSAKLQFQSPNGTWIDYPSGSLSANGIINFELPAGQIRTVTATGSAFYVYAVGSQF